jgi:hypothetical protein
MLIRLRAESEHVARQRRRLPRLAAQHLVPLLSSTQLGVGSLGQG